MIIIMLFNNIQLYMESHWPRGKIDATCMADDIFKRILTDLSENVWI